MQEKIHHCHAICTFPFSPFITLFIQNPEFQQHEHNDNTEILVQTNKQG